MTGFTESNPDICREINPETGEVTTVEFWSDNYGLIHIVKENKHIEESIEKGKDDIRDADYGWFERSQANFEEFES